MAVVIEKRPIGVILDTCVSATINQDYSSIYATVNKTAHGLSDGDYVYIQCDVENYNGFWKIDVTNADEFILIDDPYVEWIVDATITYCPQLSTHGWSCVHLPIVYELSNTRWPTNSVDTARTISSITNDNGYANLNLSGSLGTFEDLSFIKISNANDSDFDGVYQILDKLATNDITINLAYSNVTNSGLVGATVQLYYQSYVMVVRVYAGLNASHYWADQKPYELAATLQLTPDSNNKSKFSVSDILKSYIDVKNNLLGATLPNDITQFTQFYIEVAEQYDTSNGYTISTFESGFVSDQSVFEGYAVNAELPFKNIHSGYLSEYLMTNPTAKFLTLFTIPVLFGCSEENPDCYQDISFLIEDTTTAIIVTDYYSNDVLQTSSQTNLSDYDAGLYRVEINPNCSYDELRISLINAQALKNNSFNDGLDHWENDGVSGELWNAALNSAQVNFTSSSGSSKQLRQYFLEVPAGKYKIVANFTTTGDVDEVIEYEIRVFNSGGVVSTLSSGTLNISALGSNTAISSVVDVTDSISIIKIGLVKTTAIDLADVDLNDISLYVPVQKTFDIDCGCSNQEILLTWLNYLGGFEYWTFQGETEHTIDITEAGETSTNIFPDWPKSYGEFANTEKRKQTFRTSAHKKFVFSQFLTKDQADAISHIKTSPLVQIINSRQDRRTVIVDTDSFTKYKDGDKTYSISFNILYTDDIPSQRT